MKTVNFEDFNANSICNADALDRFIPEAQKTLNDVTRFMPARIVIVVSTHDNESYFERCHVELLHPEIRIWISYNNYRKRYLISCHSLHELKNIESSAYSSRNTGLTEPNHIGVLSKSKLLAWIKYYEGVYHFAKAIDAQNAFQKEAFLQSLEGLKVDWSRDKQQGRVYLNGLVFSFEVLTSYISTKIEIAYGVKHDINTFKAMTTNSSLPTPMILR